MKNVIHHFKTHPKSTEVHETSNGFMFHEKHDAVAHANELGKDKDRVKTHNRSDFEKEIAASIKADEAAASEEGKKESGKKGDKSKKVDKADKGADGEDGKSDEGKGDEEKK